MITKAVMIGITSLIFSLITVLIVSLVFSSITNKVQTTMTEVTSNVIVEEMDVLLNANKSASGIVSMQETLTELQDRLGNIFK